MEKLLTVAASPTSFDGPGNLVLFDRPDDDLYVVLTKTRDADFIDQSNWVEALELLGGESEEVVVHRFRHWAVGYIDYLCVRSETPVFSKAEDIEASLEAYPVLNDERLTDMEWDAVCNTWENDYDWKERAQFIREHEDLFNFQDYNDILNNVRGKWISADYGIVEYLL